jgi:hypothetical protein
MEEKLKEASREEEAWENLDNEWFTLILTLSTTEAGAFAEFM